MKIKTPKGEICDLDDCEEYDDKTYECNEESIISAEKQKILAEKIFKSTSILTG